MTDMLAAAKRGWELFMREPLTLLLGGLFWTLICQFTFGLLLGPALLGLFAIALKAHRGEPASVGDAFAAFDDVAAPLVAGIVFFLPFALHAKIEGVLVLTAFLFIHVAYFVYVFAILADRRCGLAEATRAAIELADGGGQRQGRMSRLARHVVYTLAVSLALFGVWNIPFPGDFPFLLIVTWPLATCMVAAWYVRDTNLAIVPPDTGDLDDDLDPGAASAG